MELKEKLAALRVEKGLSQTDVAEALDISRQAISRWESGTAVPSMENLMKLSRLYNVPLDTFVRGREEETGLAEAAGPSSGKETNKRRKWMLAAACALLALLVTAVWHMAVNKESREILDIGELKTDQVDITEVGYFDFDS